MSAADAGSRPDDAPPPSGLFGTQLLLALVVLLVAGLASSSSSPVDETGLVRGLVLLAVVTVVTAVTPAAARSLLYLVPAADVLTLVILRASAPTGGFGVLLVIPVVWVALAAGRRGALIACAGTTATIWLEAAFERSALTTLSVEPPMLSASASLNVAVLFVGVVAAAAVTRERAHRNLVRQQADSLQDMYRGARQGERLLQTVMDAVPFVIISIGPDGSTYDANRAARSMIAHLDLNPTMPITQYPLYHLDGVTPVAREDFPYLRGLRGEPVDGETYWLGHPDSPRLAIEVSARIVLDEDGTIERFVVVVLDIGGTLADEEARDRAVTSISHEFRTPLSSILGFVELAADTPGLPAEAAAHLDVAERNTTRLLTLVNDLLTTRGRSTPDVIPMTFALFDLSTVVRDAVTAARPLAHDRVVSVSLDAPRDVWIEGDSFRIRQVVDNLVSNAIKYNVDGGSVAVTVTERSEDVVLTVTDTGPGLSDRELVEVLEPYRRSRSAESSTIEGSGMGLSICRDIVTQHDGSFALQHADGGGTTARVRLPSRPEEVG